MRWSPCWRSSQLEYLRMKFWRKYLRRSLSVRSQAPPGFLIRRNVPYFTFVRTARVWCTSVPMVCISITLLSSATGRPQDASPERDGRRLNRIYPMKRKTMQSVALASVQVRILWIKRYFCLTEVIAISSANAATASQSFFPAQPDCISTWTYPSAIGHRESNANDKQANDTAQNLTDENWNRKKQKQSFANSPSIIRTLGRWDGKRSI